MNTGFFSRLLAEGMHQIAGIEFENCIFLAFEGAISPQTPIFLFNGQNFIVLERVSKK